MDSTSRKCLYRRTRLVYLAGLIVTIFSCVTSSEAATTTGRKPTQAIIPPKDTSKGGGRRVMEPAFANAGKVPGVEIWRIENFKPVPYPKGDYGKFFTGDSYIVLVTSEKSGVKSWDIHFWLGLETSQDEAGTAAILSVQLDDQLGGGPVQYREVQEHETQKFVSHFKSGLRYVPGGVASGFAHVDRNKHDKKLYHIKGKRNIRMKQVDVTIGSMNKGDCFILDIGSDVYVYVGVKSKRAERLKAISAGNVIRDQDHGGRSKVHIIDEYSPQDEYDAFFSALGGGSAQDVPDESAADDDEVFEKTQEKVISLYKISDATGKLVIQPINQKPLLQSMLDTNDCFILDTSDSNLYVWVGKKCNTQEKTEAMAKAQNFLKEKKYPSWTQVQRIVESAEPSSFQQYFKSWKGTGETHTRLIRSPETPKQKLEHKSAGEAPEFMPDDGSGLVTDIFRIENFEPVPVPKDVYGKFFGGDSYLIKYTHSNNCIIYIWQGNESTNDEKAASAMHAVTMDDALGGKATQIRVVQDHEPKHFLHVFKGKLITFLGGKASGFKNLKDHDTYVTGATRMFRVRGTNDYNVRGMQQLPEAKYLDSNDAFIVENGATAWIWMGKNAHEIERKLANNFAEQVIGDITPVVIEEEKEPQEFWKALGGKGTYNNELEENVIEHQPELYHGILTKNDHLKLEQIGDFEQDDLVEDDIMLLDADTELYVWIGKGADDDEKRLSTKVAQKYLITRGRPTSVIIVVKQGEEPKPFKSQFLVWDSDSNTKVENYERNAMKGKFDSIRAKFQN